MSVAFKVYLNTSIGAGQNDCDGRATVANIRTRFSLERKWEQHHLFSQTADKKLATSLIATCLGPLLSCSPDSQG